MHTIHANLTNAEFLRLARQELDNPGVAEVMPVVAELFTRFEIMAESADVIETIVNRFDLQDAQHLEDIIDALHGIDPDFDMTHIAEKVKRANDFWDIAQDCGDVLDRLHQLAQTCQ